MKKSIIACLFLASLAAHGQILIEEGHGGSGSTSNASSAPTRPSEEGTTNNNGSSPRQTGEGAARQYFIERKQRGTSMGGDRTPASESSGGPRYMALQIGTFMSDKQYRWGSRDRAEDVGELILGISYRMGQWKNSMDLLLRTEFISYDIDNTSPRKLSFMPVITFPDVDSNFPLYFGAGGGLGIFLDQAASESDLSFDYQVIAGLRFLNIWDSGGLLFETGIKGHVHLVSSGQFNGVFLTVGSAFSF